MRKHIPSVRFLLDVFEAAVTCFRDRKNDDAEKKIKQLYWQASAHPSRDEALEWKKIFVVKHGSKYTFDVLAFNAHVMNQCLIEINTPLNVPAGFKLDKTSSIIQQKDFTIKYSYGMNRKFPNTRFLH